MATYVYCPVKKKVVEKGDEIHRTSEGIQFTVKEYRHMARSLPAKGWGYDHTINWDKWAPDDLNPNFTRPYFENRADVERFKGMNEGSFDWDIT